MQEFLIIPADLWAPHWIAAWTCAEDQDNVTGLMWQPHILNCVLSAKLKAWTWSGLATQILQQQFHTSKSTNWNPLQMNIVHRIPRYSLNHGSAHFWLSALLWYLLLLDSVDPIVDLDFLFWIFCCCIALVWYLVPLYQLLRGTKMKVLFCVF